MDKQKLKAIPETPGAYFLKDSKGEILYIGKATNLRSRVSSYFQSAGEYLEPRLASLVRKISDVEYIVAKDHIEAALIEARLIKDIKPKYNVRLKDDKSFLCVAIIKNDDFPKVHLVRETDERLKNAEYFGPFVNSEDLRTAIKVLQKLFKFATCNLEIYEEAPARQFFRPCLLYSIKRCSAPCAGKISKEEYAQDVESFKKWLTGNKADLIEKIRQRMIQHANRLEFERASELRDQIKALEMLEQKQEFQDYIEGDLFPISPQEAISDLVKILNLDFVPRNFEAIDISNFGKGEAVGSVVVFFDGIPFKDGYRRFRIKTVNKIDDYAMTREIINRRFKRLLEEQQPLPDLVLIDGGPGHLKVASNELNKLNVDVRVLVSLAKKREQLYILGKNKPLKIPRHSPGLRLLMYIRDEAHRFAQHYHHILRRKKVLGE